MRIISSKLQQKNIMSFKPYTEKNKKTKIGICSDPDHPGSGSADPDPDPHQNQYFNQYQYLYFRKIYTFSTHFNKYTFLSAS